MPTLPTNADGSLRAFTAEEYADMDIRRRGVRADHGHVTYQMGPDGSGCTRKFSCAWDERFNAAIYFAGAGVSYNDPDTGVRKLSRLLPSRDPDYPNWICTKCEIMPWKFLGTIEDEAADSESLPVFERAELACVYEMVPFDLTTDEQTTAETDRYVTWPGYPGAEMSSDAQYIGLPGSIIQYATADGTVATGPAGVPIPYPVGFVEGSSKFKVVWRRVPFDVWGPTTALFLRLIGTASTRGYVGSVNKTAFRGYPELSLQLLGIEQRLLPDATGLGYSWDLGYLFSQKVVPYGQLGFYFHDTKTVGGQSGYYQVLRPLAGKTTIAAAGIGADDSLFPVKEFSDLFKPGV